MTWTHEQLTVRRGRRSGITTMVAVHSTDRGPALGGCRLKPYEELKDAVDDVLRLSAAMTAKSAVAGLDCGGGKSVIVLEPGRTLSARERRDVLLDHAELIASFGGTYRTGPDVGTGPADMLVFREVTPYAACAPEEAGGTGSSSGPTATGVLAALRAAATNLFGTPSLAGRHVVVSGYGSVGVHLAASLAEAGAEVTVSDIDSTKRAEAQRRGLAWADPEKALTLPADVVIPAAVGGVLTREIVPRLATRLIVGPANNQLAEDTVADDLAAAGILWVPDYVASAGGLVYTFSRDYDGMSHEAALAKVEAIEDTVESILAAARANATTPLTEAAALVRSRVTSGAVPRTPWPPEPRTAA